MFRSQQVDTFLAKNTVSYCTVPQHMPSNQFEVKQHEVQIQPQYDFIRSVVPIYRYFVDRFDEIRK